MRFAAMPASTFTTAYRGAVIWIPKRSPNKRRIAVFGSHLMMTGRTSSAEVLTERVEPNLGIGRPTVLYAYPVSEAALAQIRSDDPRVAERFEFYCCGVELANAFHELRDPIEQRQRFASSMEKQQRVFGASHPIDEDLLAALADMPDASGAALGFDRLIMLATGAKRVESVQWTPVFDPVGNSQ